MAQLPITVNGRPYTIACEDGQEDRLRQLAETLDAEVTGLAKAVGQLGDSRLLVIAGLSLIDRLTDTEGAAAGAEAQTRAALEASERRAADAEARAEAAEREADRLQTQLSEAVQRITALAASVEEA
jgi:cell division protein ZapA